MTLGERVEGESQGISIGQLQYSGVIKITRVEMSMGEKVHDPHILVLKNEVE